MSGKIVIVGAGKVGTALAVLLQKAGHSVTGIASRTLESAQKAADRLSPIPRAADSAVELTPGADIILITTRDDVIREVCEAIARSGGFRAGQVALHVSGSLPSSILSAARDEGCFIGSMHPLQSFADVDVAIKTLAGSYFCLEGDGEAVDVARGLAMALDGQVMTIRTEDKPVYHAAAVIASNFFVSIIDMSLRFYEAIGIDREKGLAALMPLIEGSLNNIRELGPVKALTGPIARGDAGVVASHLKAISSLTPEDAPAYKALARLNVGVGLAKGTLKEDAAREILDLLGE
ncbi:MAG: DUF2520 domain-containing protein [Deltaproteobacteria bacterium]|nr:MAG: DUF2520 domain-containing protein [Deltaproteobacteria bacterium]